MNSCLDAVSDLAASTATTGRSELRCTNGTLLKSQPPRTCGEFSPRRFSVFRKVLTTSPQVLPRTSRSPPPT